MPPADEGGRLPAPLAHGTRRGDPHRPEEEALAALGAGDQAIGAEGAAAAAVGSLHRAQLVVTAHCVAHQAAAAAHKLDYTVLQAPVDKPHGLRETYIVDPDGYIWVPDVPIRK